MQRCCAGLFHVAAMVALVVWLGGGIVRAQEPSVRTFIHPWHFQFEPPSAAPVRWHLPGVDVASWPIVDLFRPWSTYGAGQGSAAWYRGSFRPDDSWRSAALIVRLREDARLRVYVNGEEIPVTIVDAELPLERFGVAHVGTAFQPRRENHVALRLADPDSALGPYGTVEVAERAAAALSGREYVRLAARAVPGRLLPTWAEDRPTRWSALGVPGAPTRALVGGDGAFSATNPGPTFLPWIYEWRSGTLTRPLDGGLSSRLRDAYLPIVEQTWSAGTIQARSTVFVVRDGSGLYPTPAGRPANEGEVMYRLSVDNQGAEATDATVFLTARPYDVRGGISPIRAATVGANGRDLLINGAVAIAADRPADRGGAIALTTEGDISEWMRRGVLPAARSAHDVDGYAMAGLAYDLRLAAGGSATLTFRVPAGPHPATESPDAAPFARAEDQTVTRWRDDLQAVRLTLPDRQIVDAFRASLGHLLTAQVGTRFHPGPLEHNAFWMRDAAYIGLALSRAGHGERTRALALHVPVHQQDGGRIPPIVEPNGRLRPVDEWDAQGQGIFLLVHHYRFTRDTEYLRSVFPAISRAIDYLDALRARNENAPPPRRGLLPPSLSAEDIGSADWHHYWDDFWALTGYAEGAYAARALGDLESEARFLTARAALARDLTDSIAQVRTAQRQPQIPNGPEDHGSSSDARGTTAALWPREVLPALRPLMRDSFALYHDRYVAPYGGAFRHNLDLFWPYAGLGLAQAYLRLGMRDEAWQILRWHLAHQSFPGLYAWAEGVRADGGFGIGDMPHAWAAAETINLIRDLLLTEDGDRLVLGRGIPLAWLRTGEPLGIEFAPTEFGLAGYRIVGNLRDTGGGGVTGDVVVRRLDEAAPPGGYVLVLPVMQRSRSARVDGVDVAVTPEGYFPLPPRFREAIVSW